jgi:hypothetical protein
MRTGLRRVLGLVAITAIAMHTALWGGTATRTVATAVDPFSVICHSGENAAPDRTPINPISAPSHACDHCNLCGSTLSPLTSPAAVAVEFFPDQPSYVLESAPTIPHGGIEVALKGARGPPVVA